MATRKAIRIHTDSGTMSFTISSAREYVADYRCSEDRVRRDIAADLEDILESE